ncbi:MAG: hypothetical protein AB2A00_09150 [Myxococcota bacterium]
MDKQDSTFTVADLRSWKDAHEAWVTSRLQEELSGVGFAELEMAVRAILALPAGGTVDLSVTPPSEKLAKNGLTGRTRVLVSMGLAVAAEVREFLERMAQQIDPDYPERLRAGFVVKYKEHLAEGLNGDALFEALRAFAAPPSRAWAEQAAGLAVLSYLFEACEVFER